MTDCYSGSMGAILPPGSKITELFIGGVRAGIRNALVIGDFANT